MNRFKNARENRFTSVHPNISTAKLFELFLANGGKTAPRNCSRNSPQDGQPRDTDYRVSAEARLSSHLDAITKPIGIGKYLIRLAQRESRSGRSENVRRA